MSVVDRARTRARQAMDRAKDRLDRTIGDQRVRTSRRADRMAGIVRETADEVRDWARTAARDARRRIASHRPVS